MSLLAFILIKLIKALKHNSALDVSHYRLSKREKFYLVYDFPLKKSFTEILETTLILVTLV